MVKRKALVFAIDMSQNSRTLGRIRIQKGESKDGYEKEGRQKEGKEAREEGHSDNQAITVGFTESTEGKDLGGPPDSQTEKAGREGQPFHSSHKRWSARA